MPQPVPDLACFEIDLQPQRACTLGRNTGKALHGLFFGLLETVDPGLADALHSDNGPSAFTCSLLQGDFEMLQGRHGVVPERIYRARFTTLEPELTAAMHQAIGDTIAERWTVEIHKQPFDVVDGRIEEDPDRGLAGATSYAALLQRAEMRELDNRVRLAFETPTTFRTGQTNLLFPLPQSVFGSYLRRWQQYSNQPFTRAVTEALPLLVVAERHELRTQVLPFGPRAQFNGFVGYCQYRVLSDDIDLLRLVNALADFARFAGTGQKTGHGMGQTRRLDPLGGMRRRRPRRRR